MKGEIWDYNRYGRLARTSQVVPFTPKRRPTRTLLVQGDDQGGTRMARSRNEAIHIQRYRPHEASPPNPEDPRARQAARPSPASRVARGDARPLRVAPAKQPEFLLVRRNARTHVANFLAPKRAGAPTCVFHLRCDQLEQPGSVGIRQQIRSAQLGGSVATRAVDC